MDREVKTGQYWQHYNKNRYVVMAVVNLADEPRYPKTVVYENMLTGTQWCRRYDDWHRSFTFIGER